MLWWHFGNDEVSLTRIKRFFQRFYSSHGVFDNEAYSDITEACIRARDKRDIGLQILQLDYIDNYNRQKLMQFLQQDAIKASVELNNELEEFPIKPKSSGRAQANIPHIRGATLARERPPIGHGKVIFRQWVHANHRESSERGSPAWEDIERAEHRKRLRTLKIYELVLLYRKSYDAMDLIAEDILLSQDHHEPTMLTKMIWNVCIKIRDSDMSAEEDLDELIEGCVLFEEQDLQWFLRPAQELWEEDGQHAAEMTMEDVDEEPRQEAELEEITDQDRSITRDLRCMIQDGCNVEYEERLPQWIDWYKIKNPDWLQISLHFDPGNKQTANPAHPAQAAEPAHLAQQALQALTVLSNKGQGEHAQSPDHRYGSIWLRNEALKNVTTALRPWPRDHDSRDPHSSETHNATAFAEAESLLSLKFANQITLGEVGLYSESTYTDAPQAVPPAQAIEIIKQITSSFKSASCKQEDDAIEARLKEADDHFFGLEARSETMAISFKGRAIKWQHLARVLSRTSYIDHSFVSIFLDKLAVAAFVEWKRRVVVLHADATAMIEWRKFDRFNEHWGGRYGGADGLRAADTIQAVVFANSHIALISAHVAAREISVIDSLPAMNPRLSVATKAAECLGEYLNQPGDEFRVVYRPRIRQGNSSGCGPATCLNGFFDALGLQIQDMELDTFSFSQVRMWAVWATLTEEFHTPTFQKKKTTREAVISINRDY